MQLNPWEREQLKQVLEAGISDYPLIQKVLGAEKKGDHYKIPLTFGERTSLYAYIPQQADQEEAAFLSKIKNKLFPSESEEVEFEVMPISNGMGWTFNREKDREFILKFTDAQFSILRKSLLDIMEEMRTIEESIKRLKLTEEEKDAVNFRRSRLGRVYWDEDAPEAQKEIDIADQYTRILSIFNNVFRGKDPTEEGLLELRKKIKEAREKQNQNGSAPKASSGAMKSDISNIIQP